MVDKTLVFKVNIKFGVVRGKKGSTIPNLRQNVHVQCLIMLSIKFFLMIEINQNTNLSLFFSFTRD